MLDQFPKSSNVNNTISSKLEGNPTVTLFNDEKSIENLNRLVQENKIPNEIALKLLKKKGFKYEAYGLMLMIFDVINKYLQDKQPQEPMTSVNALQIINNFCTHLHEIISDKEIASTARFFIEDAIPDLSRMFPEKK